jgi:hypothetical protein
VELAAALDRVEAVAAWSMTADEQRDALVDLTRLQARLAELRLRVLAAAERSDVGDPSGASSTAAWLSQVTLRTRTSGHRDVALAVRLEAAFEATREALGRGRLNVEQARVIVAAVDDLPRTVSAVDRGRAEAHLVAEAVRFDAVVLRRLGRRLFEVIDPDAAEEEEGKKLEKEEREARRQTWLRMRDNGDGTWSGSFKLPDLHAAMLRKALQALISPRRVGAQERVDADGLKVGYPQLLGRGFCELLEHLPVDRLPLAGGLSASIVVTLDSKLLLAGSGAARLDTGQVISAGEARRLACTAGIVPMVLGGASMPLDVGRARRFHTPAQRVALAERDRGCTSEGCDRPPSWCESHHEVPWSHGGATSVAQGRLLCAWHHHRAHDPSYTIKRLPDNKIRFTRRT